MSTHVCIRCKGAFQANEMSSNGQNRNPTYCKRCQNEGKRILYQANLERNRRYQRNWRLMDRMVNPKKYVDIDKAKNQRERLLHPERVLARSKIQEMTRARSKVIIRLPCEVCGSINSQAHHDNYSEPLEVRWLCPLHHAEVHLAKTIH